MTPNIIPLNPLPGETISGIYTLQVKLEYPESDGDRVDVKQVMFRYLKPNCTQNCKVLIGNDLTDAFGWKIDWDTTTVPNGTYNLRIYAFAEGGELLLGQQIIENVTIDQSYQMPPKEEPAAEEPETEQPKEEPKPAPQKNTTNTTKTPEKPKSSFWQSFLAWIKSLFT